jgi:beta-phosphoglucomutase-like phosphatase (HAD superfamily)
VEAALNAGMKAVVLTTMHEQEEISAYSNTLVFVKDYKDPVLAKLYDRYPPVTS